MKSWIKSPVIIAALALFVVGSIAAIALGIANVGSGKSARPAGKAVSNESASGVPGLKAPWFALGLMRADGQQTAGAASETTNAQGNANTDLSPAAEAVFNNYPFSLTGPCISKSTDSITVRISSCSNAVRNLGYAPGVVVTLYCSEAQVASLSVGDWVNVAGITIHGQLVISIITIIPAHFGY